MVTVTVTVVTVTVTEVTVITTATVIVTAITTVSGSPQVRVSKDLTHKEALAAMPRDSMLRDSTDKDSVPRDSVPRDSTDRDSMFRDSVHRVRTDKIGRRIITITAAVTLMLNTIAAKATATAMKRVLSPFQIIPIIRTGTTAEYAQLYYTKVI